MASDILLRAVAAADLDVFFEHQRDPLANHTAAFTARDPEDRAAFVAKWSRILGDGTITKKTVLVGGAVAGSVLCHRCFGAPEVSYWLGREHWGKGVATSALGLFLGEVPTRPLYARVAADNVASRRVLEKCGFAVVGTGRGFANARGVEIEELILVLKARVTLDRVADLPDAEREEVRRLSLAVYPPEQVASWPGRHLEWSAPEWCVRVRRGDGVLVSYAGVYVRAAEHNNGPVRVGGVGNVKTHPEARRQGLASLAMRRAVEWFRGRGDIDFALLVCEPALVEYYERLGWREFGGRLVVRQQAQPAEFTLYRVMTHAVGAEAPAGGTIDLYGPPW